MLTLGIVNCNIITENEIQNDQSFCGGIYHLHKEVY